ncbi:MAG: hypothetical protein AAFR88_02805 [Pseudomonadota bacterium]
MAETLAQLERFIVAWRAKLDAQCELRFEREAVEGAAGLHTAIADGFVAKHELTPIGFNWEMLDPASETGERSAVAAMAGALTKNMVFPSQEWLGEEAAQQCARDFVACFNPAACTMLTNRMDFGWNPISEATIEWAFVGFDDQAIALVLLMAED